MRTLVRRLVEINGKWGLEKVASVEGDAVRSGPSRRGQAHEQVREQITRPSAEEPAGCGRSVGPGGSVVVDDSEGRKLARCQSMEAVPA